LRELAKRELAKREFAKRELAKRELKYGPKGLQPKAYRNVVPAYLTGYRLGVLDLNWQRSLNKSCAAS
jgi:hypothetical protein